MGRSRRPAVRPELSPEDRHLRPHRSDRAGHQRKSSGVRGRPLRAGSVRAQRRSGPRRPYTSRGREVIIQAAATIITGYPFLRGATAQSRLSASFDGDSRFRWGLTQPIAIMVIVVKVPPPLGRARLTPAPPSCPPDRFGGVLLEHRGACPTDPVNVVVSVDQWGDNVSELGAAARPSKWCWRVRRSTRTTTSPRPPMPHHSPERGIQRRGSGGDPQTPQRLFTAATAAAVAGPKPPAHSIRHRRDAAGTRPRLRGGTQRARRSDRVARQHPDRDRARHRRRDRRIESRIRHPRGLSQNRPGAKAATSARGARASTPTRAQCASFAIGRLQPQTYSSSSRGVGWHNTFFRALALRAPPPSRSRIADGRGRR